MLSFNCAMAQIRIEVRNHLGQKLAKFDDEVLDLGLPVDHARLAQNLLRLIRKDAAAAHSVHFFREGQEIGAWSVERERAEMPRAKIYQFPPAAA